MATTNPNDRDYRSDLNDVNTRDRVNDDVRRDASDVKDRDTNPDPITGAPGSHPVGTGVGAAAGGGGGTAAGAAIGAAVGGPVGAVVGGVIGAVAGAVGGGYAGKAVAEAVDPTEESAYWSAEHVKRPYYQKGYEYDTDYAPAYRHGWESRTKYADKNFDDVESDLGRDWETRRGSSKLSWDNAKSAVRDAWDRVSNKVDRAAYPDRNQPGRTTVVTPPPNDLGMTASDPRNT